MKALAEPIVDAAVEIYGRMSKDLLPTPAKSHYIFNLRDLSKCVQGMYVHMYVHTYICKHIITFCSAHGEHLVHKTAVCGTLLSDLNMCLLEKGRSNTSKTSTGLNPAFAWLLLMCFAVSSIVHDQLTIN